MTIQGAACFRARCERGIFQHDPAIPSNRGYRFVALVAWDKALTSMKWRGELKAEDASRVTAPVLCPNAASVAQFAGRSRSRYYFLRQLRLHELNTREVDDLGVT